MSEPESNLSKNIELLLGVLIAVFAAVLAINDLGAGRFGDDEMIAHNQQAKQYSWYQSKSIKQNLHENQIDLLETLEHTSLINKESKTILDSVRENKITDIKRYKKEKKEILLGSQVVGKDNWMLEDDSGALGNIIGAKEWENTAEVLGKAGDYFDLSTLFLQICIVFGAISLVIQKLSTRKIFMYLMILIGIIGSVFTILAYQTAYSI
ncbi:MAG: DUF4337 domain-containing protein [Cytophagaceae bacterium]|jgi:hypothetical protein|nr:DUF4337 domain-containing protein [Cytophagaceae bacterium]